jgi:23S rRNA-/tRNA-specific pseudouridylate synthase
MAPDGVHEIPVVAAGDGWLVVDKPSGVSVHNDPGADLCSLLEGAAGGGHERAHELPRRRLHPVNRLDKETSGLMILCSDPEALRFFARQFESGRVRKRYVALVHGRMEPAAGTEGQLCWEWPLADEGSGRRRPQGRGVLRLCRTLCRVRGFSRHYTLIDCEPESGRRHQIRRHAVLAGHPVVGDRRYGPTRAVALVRARFGFERLGLHALALSVVPPGQARAVEFCSAGIPAEITRLFDNDV